jgi:secreted PhoX family phosphatase
MTVFKVKRDASTDTLIIVEQTLEDGREGEFFNVDFANTVGETGMNCGGIQAVADGRIWTAEEWWRYDNEHIYDEGDGIRDTSDVTIDGSGIEMADGETIQKYQNFNYMVEIDPKQAVAIRKQYNWGRQPFEGGVVMPDRKTVYLGADNTPGILTKFVADAAGDFTSGTTYFYKEDSPEKWIEIDNSDLDVMLHYQDEAIAMGATMFNRLEWVAYNQGDGNVYLTETGRDNPASKWNDELADGGVFPQHHFDRANKQYVMGPDDAEYKDYYGRILKLDVETNEISVFMEGGPDFAADVDESDYPSTQLSNPDGLGFITIEGQSYMLICEDLNGTSNGRVPMGYTNRTCEMFMLDMSIENPDLEDLVRIASVPLGAEITGVRATPDGKTILFNSQHPSSSNPYPYNNSCTIALTGFDKGFVSTPEFEANGEELELYPNPAADFIYMNKTTDVGVYNGTGQLIKVLRNVDRINVSNLPAGTYYIQTAEKETKTVIVQ